MDTNLPAKVERIILRHLSGSKAGHEETFDLNQLQELTIGRHPSSSVQYDETKDDLVSGQHARITQDAADATAFTLTDLGSRNGLYVDKQRVINAVRLVPGNVIQLGAGGPEFEFDLDPRPTGQLKKTRAAALSSSGPLPKTRTSEASHSDSFSSEFASSGSLPLSTTGSSKKNSSAPAESAKSYIGKSTAYEIASSKQRETRRQMLMGGGVLLVLLGLVAWYMRPRPCTDCALTPTQVWEMNRGAVAQIQLSWKLTNTRSGQPLYHYYVANEYGRDANGNPIRIVNDNRQRVAAYVVLDDGTYEPRLTEDPGGNVPIGGSGGGTGFAVTSDGFLLTARHVGAGWMTQYQYPDSAYPGIVYVRGPGGKYVQRTIDGSPELVRPAYRWVPGNTRQAGTQGARWAVEGRHDYLNVTFPGNKTSIPARVARVSDQHDVAMLKIDMPGTVSKCELFDNYDKIKVGDTITVLGYPAVSPVTWGRVTSQDPFNSQSQNKVIPDPSLTTGNIGRLLRTQKSGNGGDEVQSDMGDVYQVTANPGGGNSGGPVFDDRGKVVGIYFAGSQASGGQVSFAVPIRYGLELMK